MKIRCAILQPEIPHYRQDFFRLLKDHCETMDLFVYNTCERTKKDGIHLVETDCEYISNLDYRGKILLYNPFPLLSKKYNAIVLMLHFGHITTWLILLFKFIHRKKIILWGQGISVKRYIKESSHPDWKLKWQIAMADAVLLYQEPQAYQWKRLFPKKSIVSLNNTISDVNEILKTSTAIDKDCLRQKYSISQPVIFIFCARFENKYRRVDLLIETIEKLDSKKYGFIIIGSGKNKPDFSNYKNVYDFGAVYDRALKNELFSIADVYFQPGWVGLSIVEAMAYGKPVCTFVRSEETLQCVEYSYIEDGINGYIFNDMDDCIEKITHTPLEDMVKMGSNARKLVKDYLTPDKMAIKVYTVLESFK